jgi:Zinc finger, C3HC4 type (RING finger)
MPPRVHCNDKTLHIKDYEMAHIIGDRNVIYGNCVSITGSYNRVQGNVDHLNGHYNDIKGDCKVIQGSHNSSGWYETSYGHGNIKLLEVRTIPVPSPLSYTSSPLTEKQMESIPAVELTHLHDRFFLGPGGETYIQRVQNPRLYANHPIGNKVVRRLGHDEPPSPPHPHPRSLSISIPPPYEHSDPTTPYEDRAPDAEMEPGSSSSSQPLPPLALSLAHHEEAYSVQEPRYSPPPSPVRADDWYKRNPTSPTVPEPSAPQSMPPLSQGTAPPPTPSSTQVEIDRPRTSKAEALVRMQRKRPAPLSPSSSSSSSSSENSDSDDDDEVQEISRTSVTKKRTVVATNFYRPVQPLPNPRHRRRVPRPPIIDKDDVIPSFRKPLVSKIDDSEDKEAKGKEAICKICLVNKVRLIYGPCNHGCVCVTCYRSCLSAAIKQKGADCMKCPLCKGEVKTVAPFYVD